MRCWSARCAPIWCTATSPDVGGGKMPDAKTMGRWGVALGPEVLKQIHERMVKIAQDNGVIAGRRMRVDTTVVETNIHHPTDSTLLGDGVRVLTRIMKKITDIAGAVGNQAARPQPERETAAVRDRAGGARQRPAQSGQIEAALSPVAGCNEPGRGTGEALLRGDVRRSEAVSECSAADWCWRACAESLRDDAARRQVMKQTRARIFRGDTRSEGKLLSVFEPSTEVIRKGKAGKPNEFGKMVKLQEAENQIITDYEVYARRPNDSDLLDRSHRDASSNAGTHAATWWRRTPDSIPPRTRRPRRQRASSACAFPIARPRASSASASRRKRWFRNGQKWRTGCEGRISVVKRRHGLDRCRYKGDDRNEPLGRPRRDRRQCRQHRSRHEKTSCPLSRPVTSDSSQPAGRPGGFCFATRR